MLVFKRGRSRKKKEEWKWGDDDIEEVKDFKYLGFHFQKNGGTEVHMKETVKKTMIAIKQTWRIGQRRFKNNFERRIKTYNSIMLYAAEVWGWKEVEKLEKLQVKYIKWTLGLDFNTPTYIVMEETKTDKIRIEAGRRATRYEERTRTLRVNKIIQECWREIDAKRENRMSRWEGERIRYYREKGIERQDLTERWTGCGGRSIGPHKKPNPRYAPDAQERSSRRAHQRATFLKCEKRLGTYINNSDLRSK